jgi:hypothetical protein
MSTPRKNTRKNTIFALAILTLGSAAFATGAEARPRHWGWGAGAAIAGGVVLGSMLAASHAHAAEPVYVEDDAPRRCFTVERFNRFGEVIGLRRVCRRGY